MKAITLPEELQEEIAFLFQAGIHEEDLMDAFHLDLNDIFALEEKYPISEDYEELIDYTSQRQEISEIQELFLRSIEIPDEVKFAFIDNHNGFTMEGLYEALHVNPDRYINHLRKIGKIKEDEDN